MFILKLGNKTHPITKDVVSIPFIWICRLFCTVTTWLVFFFQTKIGRHTSNDIVLAETRVSRFHVEIVVINERIFLIDKKVRFVEFCHDFMEVDMNGWTFWIPHRSRFVFEKKNMSCRKMILLFDLRIYGYLCDRCLTSWFPSKTFY